MQNSGSKEKTEQANIAKANRKLTNSKNPPPKPSVFHLPYPELSNPTPMNHYTAKQTNK